MGQDNPLLFPAGIDEKYYRKVLDSTNEGVIRVNDKGVITYANPKFCELFDFSSKKLLGQNLFSFIDKKEISDQTLKLNNRLHGKSESYERTLVGKNHRVYHCFITAFPIFAKDGSFIGSFALVKDITAEKIEFEKFTESQRNFNALAKSLPDVVSRYDRKLKIIYINDAIKQISGLEPGEYLGKSNEMLDLPEDQAVLWHKALESAFSLKKETSIEFERNTPAGLRYFETRIIPEFSEDGSVQTVFCVTRDFTDQVNADRKKREEDANWLALLEQADERIRLAAQAAHLGVWEWDILADKLIWDDHMFELYGLKRENFIPVYARWRDAIHPDDVAKSDIEMKRALEERVPYDTEFRVILPDHRIRWIRAFGQVLSNSSGQPARMIGVNFDITEYKWIEDANRSTAEAEGQIAHASEEKEIYQTIGKKVQEIVSNGYVGVITFNESQQSFQLKGSYGSEEQIQKILNTNKIDLLTAAINIKDMAAYTLSEFRKGKLERFEGGIYLLASKKIPKSICSSIEKELGISKFYTMGLVVGDQNFGGIIICGRDDLTPVTGNIESVINLATESIKKLRSEIALRESEARFRGLFEDSPVAQWEEDFSEIKAYLDDLRSQGVTDIGAFFEDHPQEVAKCVSLLKVLGVNQASVRLLGAKNKSDLFANVDRILHRRGYADFINELAHISQGKTDFDWEGINTSLDGKTLHIYYKWSAAPNYEKSLARVFVSSIDVTSTRRAEIQLRESEARFRSLFDDSPIAVWQEDFSAVKQRLDVLHAQGITDFRDYFSSRPQEVIDCARLVKIMDVNKAAVRLLHAKSKREIFEKINLILGMQDYSSFAQELAEIANGKTNFEWEGINYTVDGKPLVLNLQWSAAPNYKDTLARVIVSTVDVTERKQAEDQLRENERQISTLMSNLPGMVYRCLNDKNWTMEFVSEGSLTLTGYSPDDFVKNRIYYNDIILAEDREMVWQEIQKAEKENLPFQLTYRIRTKANKIKWVWEQGREVGIDGKRESLEGFITDITERTISEQSLLLVSEVQKQIVPLQDSKEIIRLVGQKISDLLGDAIIGVTILDEKEQAMRLIGHYGFNDIYDKLSRQFNIDLSGIPLYLKDFTPAELKLFRSSKLEKFDGALYRLLLKNISRTVSQIAEKELKVNGIYVIGFIRHGMHFGGLAILARSSIDPYIETIETIINQAAILVDRLYSEEALRESEERFHRIFDESPLGILIADADSRYINTNRMASQILGYSQEELINLTFKEITYPDDYESNVSLRDQLLRGEIPLFRVSKRYIRKDGRIIWANITVTGIHSKEGNILGTIAMIEDITEKKQSAEALEYEQYLIQTLMENIPDSVYFKDLENRFIRVNQATVTKMGASTINEVLGKTDADFFSPEIAKEGMDEENEILHTGKPVINVEGMEVWKDNRPTTWSSNTKMPLSDKTGDIVGTFGVSRDITQLKAKEEEIKHLNADLEKRVESRTKELMLRNQELEAFTYSISHDLKAPLRGITGYAQLLLQEHSRQLDEEGQSFLNKLLLSSEQLSELIDDLLEYTRMERRPLNRQSLSVTEIIDAVIDERIPDIHACHILLHKNIEEASIYSSPELLTQIFRNYLDNAIKFTGKTDHPEIWIDYKNQGDTSLFSIRDNGIGFDMKYNEKIFDVFYRLHRVDEFSGTGIGLALVKKAADLLGYRAWGVSEVNAGATFFLELIEPQPAE